MATTTSAIHKSKSSPGPQPTCIDPQEIFFWNNPEQQSYRSAPLHSSDANNTLLPTQPNGQQTFAGPSHQYDRFKQNIPPPTGALATTVAVNQADFFMPRPSYSHLLSDNYLALGETDDLDTPPSLLSGFGQLDRDMDYDSSSFSTDYVDSLGIGGQEPLSASFQPPQPQRFYPGMHQEAALAKAQKAEAEQKMLQAQRQSQQPQRAFAQPGPPLRRSNGRAASHSAPDPVVEARISRLLNQMRQSSVASSNDDDTATATASGNSTQNMRMRKDEEDMDEDERLLASEEGKKLSSKERRQLRNKVSARAFRSRRKGKSSLICT